MEVPSADGEGAEMHRVVAVRLHPNYCADASAFGATDGAVRHTTLPTSFFAQAPDNSRESAHEQEVGYFKKSKFLNCIGGPFRLLCKENRGRWMTTISWQKCTDGISNESIFWNCFYLFCLQLFNCRLNDSLPTKSTKDSYIPAFLTQYASTNEASGETRSFDGVAFLEYDAE